MTSAQIAAVIAIATLAGALVTVEIGQTVGRKRKRDSASTSQLGTLQGAVLGLLALLLGFSFSGASTRFVERQDLIVREANAIGSAFLRADLLAEPHRSDLRVKLRAYTASRVSVFNASSMTETEAALADSALLHLPIWESARAGVANTPQLAAAVLDPVNEIIDVHSIRDAAIHRHLPGMVILCLFGSAAAALFIVGYADGITGLRNRAMSTALALLIALVLWVTIDLDNPRRGMIQINQFAMEQLLVDIDSTLKPSISTKK